MNQRETQASTFSTRERGKFGRGTFRGDEWRLPEVRAYMERNRAPKIEEPSVSDRPYIVEQEAARLKMYGLIGEMNELGIWGKA